MTAPLAFALLAAAMLSISMGAGRFVVWLLDRREERASRPSRQDAYLAQARAEVSNV